MTAICFYFQVHQPDRLRDYRYFEIEKSPFYLNNVQNELIINRIANKCYFPMIKLLKKIIQETNGEFKCAFSLSGVFLEQAQIFVPSLITVFQELVETNCVEILAETYYHSLSFLYSPEEWKAQIKKHEEKIFEIFKIKPQVFRNTELIYNNSIGQEIANLGYKGILAEGHEKFLNWLSPNYVYQAANNTAFKVLLRNYKLSDDIAFRFSDQTWSEWPLTTDKFTNWINSFQDDSQCLNLFMDFETFGEHQADQTGIFEFMRYLPAEILKNKHKFVKPSEAIEEFKPVGTYNCPEFSSWADENRDLSAWQSNNMQKEIFEKVYELEAKVKSTQNKDLIDIWQRLTTSDHFYYISTKDYNDGEVHKYFSPYETPYDAYINCMNIIADLTYRIDQALLLEKPNHIEENTYQPEKITSQLENIINVIKDLKKDDNNNKLQKNLSSVVCKK